MDRPRQYAPFLKSLRAAITNVSVYFPEHPIFIKSIEDLKTKIDQLLGQDSSLDIEITQDDFFCQGQKLALSRFVEDIKNFFHQRKIKNIKIKKGSSSQSLTIFLRKVSLSSKDILFDGGLRNILAKAKVSDITIEDLDYSTLLANEGVEYKYAWFYVLRNSLKNRDAAELQTLADSFEKMLGQLDLHDPADLKQLEIIITDFFAYLQKNDKVRLLNCLSSFAKLILESPEGFSTLGIDKLRGAFSDLNSDNLAGILFIRLQNAENFDSLNFSLFSQLVRRDDHKQIASSLAEKLKQAKWMRDNPQALERIQNIFSLSKDSYISDVYRHNLFSILSAVSLGEGASFDRKILQNNYRLMLLDLLLIEADSKRLNTIIAKIIIDLSDCFQSNNQAYVDKFVKVFENKRKQAIGLEPFFQESEERLSKLLEGAVFSQKLAFDFSRFISIVRKPASDSEFYLNKIFKEQVTNSYVFQLFFKFFPKEIDRFCSKIHRHIRQVVMLKNIISGLKRLDSRMALRVFKRIFASSTEFIKLEVLKAMGELSFCDEAFLFAVLNTKKTLFRKQAFMTLVKYPNLRTRLAKELLVYNNSFGIRTSLLLENLGFIAENPFTEARQYLKNLSRYKFFWNRPVRREAANILVKYGS